MRRQTGILIGSILTVLGVAGCALGITLLVIAHGMSAHTDEARATKLTIEYEENYLGSQEKKATIEKEIAALRTSKWKLYNAGLPLSLTSALLLIAILRFRLWDVRRTRSVTTPLTRFRLLMLASGAWLTLYPALLMDLDDDYRQDDLTPTIDTGHGAFAFFGLAFFPTSLIVIILLGRFVVLRKALVPANLWFWDSERPRRSLIWTVLYGLLGAILVILTALSVQAGPRALPSLIVGLYVVASTRAAILNRA